jgi:hypothetical protein
MQDCCVTQFVIRKWLLKKESAQTFGSSHMELCFLQITLQLVRSCTLQSLRSKISVSLQVLAVWHFMGMVDTEIPTEM